MSVAVVMPAYREEANLAATVEDFLTTLESDDHWVIVVVDGSPDGTGRVADLLASRFPGRVRVVHHPANLGYGAAVRTGIALALADTGARRIFLTDSDGQFRARGLPELIAEAERERADVVIGYRSPRADPPGRRMAGAAWTWLNRLLLGIGARDVDCAYKLFDRHVLERLDLRADAATISPELLVKLRHRDVRIIQRPVEHFPRLHGEQSGGRLPVALRSLRSLLALWAEVSGSTRAGRAAHRVIRPRDPVLAVLTVLAAVLSVAAWQHFDAVRLAYPDSISHLLISRRVISSPTPGLAQLGGVWLPLPHLLTLPLVWIDGWYHSGWAATAVSMAAYVLAIRYLYRTALLLTGSRWAGATAAAVLALCPAVLYLQSTPMTELPLLACLAATVYHLTAWRRTEDYRSLAAAGAAVLLATLTRYEGWVIAALAAVIVGWTVWRRSPRRRRLVRAEAHVIFYGTLAFAGIALWLVWNGVIFGDPLYFYAGEYAKPSLWVSRDELTAGDWRASLLTYGYAVAGNLGPVLPLLAAAGLAVHVLRRRDPVCLLPLVLALFFVCALYTGQRPLHVEEIAGDLYNVRFGLIVILPVALLAGGLAAEAARAGRPAAALAGAFAVVACPLATAELDVRREAEAFRTGEAVRSGLRAAAWLRSHYDGGRVLMQSFGNEVLTFHSRVPTGSILYEGSFRQWKAALADPAANGVRWIHMRRTPGDRDRVWKALDGDPALRGYTPVYDDGDRVVYRAGVRR
ncbi:glycosyltransferase family 2 protein [Nonomuraea sp. SBT364]|uniref:glycosyltransferase family 2 protein n=1 Tax=Nonomuraea sp. SBT364 TaxID=1580530 RepID=UPI000B266525|nr:glycosyltransferase family 2 protein [Nonomuraea sp. SBT364]